MVRTAGWGRTVARARLAARYERIAWRRRSPIIEGQVLYEAFSGTGMLDNPEAIFQELRRADDLRHLSHVWVLDDLDAHRSTIQRYHDDPRVTFVRHGSDRYHEAVARSQYLINNATFPPEFGKREGQVYVNTWHGVPLKHMGYDIPGGGPGTRNIVRNLVSADYLLSANEFMTRSMYETAYKLRGIYRGRLIQEGSPRIDRQFTGASEREALLDDLRARGVRVDPGREVVLYAPTWRGSFYAPVNDAVQLLNRVRRLDRAIDGSRYRVLLKVHQRVYDFAAAHPELRDLLVPNDIPTNLMLAATDVLVTDYSSVFFDFLPTGRPVLFHQPDEEAYAGDRGLYLPPDQLPGPVGRTVEELAANLLALGGGGAGDPLVSHAERYENARRRFCPREDGHAAERIVDIVFRGRTDGYDVRADFSDGRTSILIYLGGMRSNGITRSVLSLLNNIDHDRFDVSAFYAGSSNSDVRSNEAAINPNVRLFPRIGGMNGSKVLWFGRQAMLSRGANAVRPGQRRRQNRALRDEWLRCFGASRFDHIVDFSGYSPFWDFVLLQGEARTHSVFLHNDLMADSQREVNGVRPHERNLRSVFSTYAEFDNLVSVSPALSKINAQKLSGYAGSARFVSAVNTTNHELVLRMAHGRTGAPCGPRDSAGLPVDVADLPGAISALMRHHSIASVLEEATRREAVQRLVAAGPGAVTFVTAGRLSPEKNHDRLIRAFDLVHQDHPRARLVIMGQGPLRGQLSDLIAELGLITVATLAGQLANPYGIMAAADCFVLSSDYEGQPVVLLEALVLGLPIVTTDFASVHGALPDGCGRIVPASVEGLAGGMRAYLAGAVPAATLDAVAYNRDAVQQFYDAIGATSVDRERLSTERRPAPGQEVEVEMGLLKRGNAALTSLTGYRVVAARPSSPPAPVAPPPPPPPRPVPTDPAPPPEPKLPADLDDAAKEIIRTVRPYTMTSPDKLYALITAARYVSRYRIPGDVVECGVWRGGSMQAAALALTAAGDRGRHLYLFDTYEGMPPPTEADLRVHDGSSAQDLLNGQARDSKIWAVAGLDDVRTSFASVDYPQEQVHFVQGLVQDTVPAQGPEQISILRLDTDWYESTRHELEHLYPRLSPGGVLLIDDYGYWQGSRRAVDEFIDRTGARLMLMRMSSGRMAIKPS